MSIGSLQMDGIKNAVYDKMGRSHLRAYLTAWPIDDSPFQKGGKIRFAVQMVYPT
jgi:hypothetical protein